jgi:hypothetical protein
MLTAAAITTAKLLPLLLLLSPHTHTLNCRLQAERQERAGAEALIIAKLREALIEEGRRRRYRYSEELGAARCELKRVRAVSSSCIL